MSTFAQTQNPAPSPAFDARRAIKWFVIAAAVVAFLIWLAPYGMAQKPGRLVESAIRGLLVGGVYSLVALGIVIINKASGVFNFAHGYMMLAGGLIFHAFFSVTQGEPVPAFLFSAFVVFMLAVFVVLELPSILAGPIIIAALVVGAWLFLRWASGELGKPGD